MKKILVAAALLASLLVATTVSAQATTKMAVGGYLGAGFSFAAGDGPENYVGADRDDRTGKFSGAIGAYFDYYFIPMLGIEAGLGFISQGVHWKDDDVFMKVRHFYMELPVMAKLNIKNFHVAAGLAFWFALSGKTSFDIGIADDEDTWSGDDWDYFHRVNLGFKFQAGYAIPVGPIAIVPGLQWNIHLVNDLNRPEIDDDVPGDIDNSDYRSRYNALLLTCSVEWGF